MSSLCLSLLLFLPFLLLFHFLIHEAKLERREAKKVRLCVHLVVGSLLLLRLRYEQKCA